jgi:hypothetical protein
MALEHPVAVYSALSNLQALLVRDLLRSAEIEAEVTEDLSPAGLVKGREPARENPEAQVWTNPADVERARTLIDDYERYQAQRRGDLPADGGPSIVVTCDRCAKQSAFPAVQRGTVQDCPHCGAFVDVGEDELPEGWDQPEPESLEDDGHIQE